MNAGYLCARNAQIGEEIMERFCTFRERTRLRRPIVHLQIDIGGPLAAPPGPQTLIPDALQIRGLTARAGGRDEQISADSIEECN
jgi:hypothetical protein